MIYFYYFLSLLPFAFLNAYLDIVCLDLSVSMITILVVQNYFFTGLLIRTNGTNDGLANWLQNAYPFLFWTGLCVLLILAKSHA